MTFSALKSPAEVLLLNADRSKMADNGLFTFNDDNYEYDQQNGLLTARGPLSKAFNLMVQKLMSFLYKNIFTQNKILSF